MRLIHRVLPKVAQAPADFCGAPSGRCCRAASAARTCDFLDRTLLLGCQSRPLCCRSHLRLLDHALLLGCWYRSLLRLLDEALLLSCCGRPLLLLQRQPLLFGCCRPLLRVLDLALLLGCYSRSLLRFQGLASSLFRTETLGG